LGLHQIEGNVVAVPHEPSEQLVKNHWKTVA
jgi:hypothetical protein